ncbi:glutaminyl-peptide cyclotransferase [Pedobacter namyangjuensis]|uniref:glutaminyl-peptide cyclotransferase n=1 Tax=Pedobacter namyangjuensis TaxID=600626 RepID=UPI000DE42EB2|nr:glutaminyl-peptide cyclotransferase [Pedobacter namyangjuensis]
MNNKTLLSLAFIFIVALTISSCKTDKSLVSFSQPLQGDNIFLGDDVNIKLDIPEGEKIDSVIYLIDDKVVAKTSNADSVLLGTGNLSLGYRTLSAVVAQGDKRDTIITNIVLKTNHVPLALNYKVINTFPHDTSAYTQGLTYVDGKLLESTGSYGKSELKYVELNTGKTIQRTKLEPKYFGEGSVKVGDKIIVLTWQENVGLVYDASTLNLLSTFPYQSSREGWGLTFDGKKLLRSDGSNKIWTMNASTYEVESYIEVYDNLGEVQRLNELEYINGKIYANVYLTNNIVIINPVSGVVEAKIDLAALEPKGFFKDDDERQNNVLNGIAWDSKTNRLFVTGKKWPKLYEIKIDQTLAK